MKKENWHATWITIMVSTVFILGAVIAILIAFMRPSDELKTGTWVSEEKNIVVYVDYESEMYQAIFRFEGLYIDDAGVEHKICVSFDRGRGNLTIYDAAAFDGVKLEYENAIIYFDGYYSVNLWNNKVSCSPKETKKIMEIDEAFTLVLVKE